MAEALYALCAATSMACAVLLFRGFRTSRARLLFWSSCCFIGFALNNLLLFIDLVLVPAVDLGLWRRLSALGAVVLLLIGLVFDSEADGR